MYDLIEYSKTYSETSGSLWNYYRDEPDEAITDAKSVEFKTSIVGSTLNYSDKFQVGIAVPLKYLNNLWKTLEMPLIDCELNYQFIDLNLVLKLCNNQCGNTS